MLTPMNFMATGRCRWPALGVFAGTADDHRGDGILPRWDVTKSDMTISPLCYLPYLWISHT